MHAPEAVPQKRLRMLGMDTGRVLATILVVMQHLASPLVALRGVAPANVWLLGLTVQSFARFSVPIFVMISGALLLRPSGESASHFYSKRAHRIAIPAVVWILVYLVFTYTFLGFEYHPSAVFISILRGQPYNHLYFLYAILGLYVLTPFLRVLVAGLSVQQMRWLTAIALGGVSLDVLIRSATGLPFAHSALTWSIAFLGYYLLGYCLVELRVSRRNAWIAAGVWTAAGIVSVFVLVQMTSAPMQRYAGYFANVFSPLVIAMAVSAFLLLPRIESTLFTRFKFAPRVLPRLASLTFGVYLVHEMFVGALYKYYGTIVAERSPALWIAATTVLVTVASFVVVDVLSAHRMTRWVFGVEARPRRAGDSSAVALDAETSRTPSPEA